MVGQLKAGRAMGHSTTWADAPPGPPRGDHVRPRGAAIDGFASDWSLAADDVRMWICLREATNQAVLGRPQVRARLDELITSALEAFSPSTQALDERMVGHRPQRHGRAPGRLR